MSKTYTQKQIREACAPLATGAQSGVFVGPAWIERQFPLTGVSLGNVTVRVFVNGTFLAAGRFNDVIKCVVHELNKP